MYFRCPSYKHSISLQGDTATIDIQSPSTVLGGREVTVERRCVVRLELGTRCVAVRCRADRPLRRVVRPVLERYRLPHRHVVQNGHLVHPDTLMQVRRETLASF